MADPAAAILIKTLPGSGLGTGIVVFSKANWPFLKMKAVWVSGIALEDILDEWNLAVWFIVG